MNIGKHNFGPGETYIIKLDHGYASTREHAAEHCRKIMSWAEKHPDIILARKSTSRFVTTFWAVNDSTDDVIINFM